MSSKTVNTNLRRVFTLGCVLLGGCSTTYNAHQTPQEVMEKEGHVVFVRPDQYTLLGTRSIRDYIEITYEKFAMNEAGYPVLRLGIRNRGGQRWYDVKGPDVQLSVQTAFYKDPILPGGAVSGPAAYRTNWQTVKLVRGQTTDYEVSCPIKDLQDYQVTISEYLK